MKLTARQLMLRKKYTRRVSYVRTCHHVFLQVDLQGFEIAKVPAEKRAEWYRTMLAIALDRLIENEGGKK